MQGRRRLRGLKLVPGLQLGARGGTAPGTGHGSQGTGGEGRAEAERERGAAGGVEEGGGGGTVPSILPSSSQSPTRPSSSLVPRETEGATTTSPGTSSQEREPADAPLPRPQPVPSRVVVSQSSAGRLIGFSYIRALGSDPATDRRPQHYSPGLRSHSLRALSSPPKRAIHTC